MPYAHWRRQLDGAVSPQRIARHHKQLLGLAPRYTPYLKATTDSLVRRTVRRYKNLFTVIEGGRIGLLEKSTS
jgi:hypothetical protein